MGARHEESMGWAETSQFVIMLIATLVAAMAFLSILLPPGGFWTRDGPSADRIEYVAGSPKMAYLSPRTYLLVVVSSTVAYVGAISIMLSVLIRAISSLVREAVSWTQMVWEVVLMVMTWVAVCCLSMAFTIILGVVAPSQYATTSYVLLSTVQVWSCLSWFLLPGFFIWRKITRMFDQDHEKQILPDGLV